MNIKRCVLWDKIPGSVYYEPRLEHYIPEAKKTDSAILIIPGSAYRYDPYRPKQEGERVAKYFCAMGINVFQLRYRVSPDSFPLPILDGRRAMRYIRYHSNEFGIDKNSIAVIGYSSGGHLAASLFNYFDDIEFEHMDDIDKECFIPNYQVLCYPVIGFKRDKYYTHQGSTINLCPENYEQVREKLSFEFSDTKITAPTFIWHNFDDDAVNVVNSLKYAENLKNRGVCTEIHIFPDGNHGIGLPVEDTKELKHAGKWIELLNEWFVYQDFYK